MEELRFVKLSEKATLPTRAHDNDAGLDLYAAEGARIPSGSAGSASARAWLSQFRMASRAWSCLAPDWRSSTALRWSTHPG